MSELWLGSCCGVMVSLWLSMCRLREWREDATVFPEAAAAYIRYTKVTSSLLGSHFRIKTKP